MPKTKLRHATQSDSQQARLDAASKFVEGDRVIHRQTGKVGKFVSINRGFAVIDVWVEFESDTESTIPISCNPLELELIQQCYEYTQSLVTSVGSQVCATEQLQTPDLNTNSELLNSSKQSHTVELYSLDTSPPPRVTTTSTLSEPLLETPVPLLRLRSPKGGSASLSHGEELRQSQQISEIDDFTSDSKYQLEVTKTDNVVCNPDLGNTVELGLTSSTSDEALLSCEELQARHRLELKVERAFVEAGNALKEIRDRRLYRDTYPDDFAGYCRARFDKTHRAVNYLIAAAEIYENLTGTICSREDKCQTGTICSRVLPTKESQVRDLAGLDPDDQRSIWKEAVEINGGKVPTGRIVKGIVQRQQGIVERIQERNPPVDSFVEGDVVEIKRMSEKYRM